MAATADCVCIENTAVWDEQSTGVQLWDIDYVGWCGKFVVPGLLLLHEVEGDEGEEESRGGGEEG